MTGKIGAHVKYSRLDKAGRAAATAKARAALDQKWLDEAGGDPVRAEHLRQAHYSRMALASAMVRRKPRLLRTKLAEVQAELVKAEAEAAELDHDDVA
jgi:hypothetical protein